VNGAFRYDPERWRLVQFEPRTGREIASVASARPMPESAPWIGPHPAGGVIFCEATGGVSHWVPETGAKTVRQGERKFERGETSPGGRYLALIAEVGGRRTPRTRPGLVRPRTSLLDDRVLAGAPGEVSPDDAPAAIASVVDLSTWRLLGDVKLANLTEGVRFARDDSRLAVSAPLPTGVSRPEIGQIEVRELPDLSLIRTFDGRSIGGFEPDGRLLFHGRTGKQVWRLDAEGPDELDRHPPIYDEYRRLYLQGRRFVTNFKPDGSPRAIMATGGWIEERNLPSRWQWVEDLLRKTPLQRLETGTLYCYGEGWRVDSEFEFQRLLPPGEKEGGFKPRFASEGSRIALEDGAQLVVIDLPPRRRWLAIALYPLLGVAAAIAAWRILRVGWNRVRRGWSKEASA
jgi:hypothetical protein